MEKRRRADLYWIERTPIALFTKPSMSLTQHRHAPTVQKVCRRCALTLVVMRGCRVLHPNQFQVDEAWIVFKLNDEPVHTELNGDFNFLALMDAASCFLLSYAPVAAQVTEPTQMESRRLLEEGKAHKMQLPKILFVPIEQPAQFLAAEAERVGIEVVRVEEYQLLVFIGEAREGFKEHLGGGAQ
jgi:hypothetical protein